MRGGHRPIHIQRFAPADLHSDEHVQLLEKRRDYRTLNFYRCFIDYSFMAGGDLPADPDALAAIVKMPTKDVAAALLFCVGRLVFRAGDRLFQKRVRREVAKELRFRRGQAEIGKRGGRPSLKRVAKGKPKATVLDSKSPPTPYPYPYPLPAPTPVPTPAPAAAAAGATTRAEAPAPPNGPGPPPPATATTPGACPVCHADGTLRQRQDGSGWFCGPLLGGCDGKFALDDPEILAQLRPDVADAIRRRANPAAAPDPERERCRRQVAAMLAQCEPSGGVLDQVLEAAKARVDPAAWATWFQPLWDLGILRDDEGDRLFVGVPRPEFVGWLRRQHGGVIEAALEETGHGGLEVWFATSEQVSALRGVETAGPERAEEEP